MFFRSVGCLVGARFDELVRWFFVFVGRVVVPFLLMCWLVCFVFVGSVRRYVGFVVLGLVDWSDFLVRFGYLSGRSVDLTDWSFGRSDCWVVWSV